MLNKCLSFYYSSYITVNSLFSVLLLWSFKKKKAAWLNAYQLEVPICPPSWVQFGNDADIENIIPLKISSQFSSFQ